MLNNIIIMGRLTREPELKTTQAGKSVCTITLAVERDFADPNGVREADFIDVVCWRHTAEFVAKWFRKGQLISERIVYTSRELRVPKGAKLLCRAAYLPGEAQYIRYTKPEKDKKRGGRTVRNE